MFGLSTGHLLILGIVVLLFGGKRLPELGASLGKGMRSFKDAIEGIEKPQEESQLVTSPKKDRQSLL